MTIALIIVVSSVSQVKIQYRAQNYVGLLEGEAKAAFQLQTSHGVQFGSWYTALGAGLDYYRYRSIPLFFTLNRDIKVNHRVFFVSGDVGVNLPWVNEPTYTIWSAPSTEDYKAGLYWGGGLGYKAYFKNKSDAIILNLGYSFKQLKQEQTVGGTCIDPPCTTVTERYDYKMNRVSVRVGWQF